MTIHDDIIKKAVQESIDKFLKSLKKADITSARIDGDIPDARKYLKTFDNIDSFNEKEFIIGEGLITTYPLNKTINHITRKYGLQDNQVQITATNNGVMSIGIISIILPRSVDSNVLGNIKHDLQTYGYFMSENPTQIPNTNYFSISFEPKFTKDITELIKQNCRYLYHSAPKIYVDKIIKNGLIPKSKNDALFYPDRVFFMVGDDISNKQRKIIKNIQNERNKNIDNCNKHKNPKENKEYVLLTIDITKLPENITFHSDPMAHGAIFTYDNIPPSSIIKIEPFTL